jgi:hypothetical protein
VRFRVRRFNNNSSKEIVGPDAENLTIGFWAGKQKRLRCFIGSS